LVRPLRVHLAGGFYHATLRGNHQQDIFREASDRDLLNAIVEKSLDRHAAQVHAYCWMSNHLHFLVRVAAVPLGHVMRDIASNYARAFQLKIPTTGHLFERRYHATLVDVDSYLLEVLRYIHLNPVAAGIVRQVSDYPWSSHAAYAGARRPAWVTTDFALAMFNASRSRAHEAYCRFVETVPDTALRELNLGAAGVSGADPLNAPIPVPAIRPKLKLSLAELALEACARFGIDEALLNSAARTRQIIEARAWIAKTATEKAYGHAFRRCQVPWARSGDLAACHAAVRGVH
jgi:putative transposase